MTHSYRNCPLWGRFRERIASACDSISFSCLHIEKLQYQRERPIFLVLEAAWQKLNQFIAKIFLKGTRTWNIFSASAPMVAWGACSIKSLMTTLKCWIYAEVFDQKFRSCRRMDVGNNGGEQMGNKTKCPPLSWQSSYSGGGRSVLSQNSRDVHFPETRMTCVPVFPGSKLIIIVNRYK